MQKFVLQLEAQLADRNITIELADEAANWLAERGYDPLMGARPLARLIQETIKTPLAEEVLFGKLKGGGAVKVILTTDAEGVAKLGFEYPDGPVTPKAEVVGRERSEDPDAGGDKAAPKKRPAKPEGERRASAARTPPLVRT